MEIDSETWYQISSIADETSYALIGTNSFYSEGSGIVTIGLPDYQDPSQRWQIHPVGLSSYVLRTEASGPKTYLTRDGTSCENSRLSMTSQERVNESTVWQVVASPNGASRISNTILGQKCYLEFSNAGVRASRRTMPKSPQTFKLAGSDSIDDESFSVVKIEIASSSTVAPALTTTTSSMILRNQLGTSTTLATRTSHSTSTPTSSLLPPFTRSTSRPLSPPAALGVGIGIGIISTLLILCLLFLLHRFWNARRSRNSRRYHKARMWKGFTPVTPSSGTARTTLVETKMANIYFAELPTPATPAFLISPPVDGSFEHVSGESRNDDRFSWQRLSGGGVSPCEADGAAMVIPGEHGRERNNMS